MVTVLRAIIYGNRFPKLNMIIYAPSERMIGIDF